MTPIPPYFAHCREIVEPKLTDGQCSICSGRSTMDQIFALHQVFEKLWEYVKEVKACFVDLKAYDQMFLRQALGGAVIVWH